MFVFFLGGGGAVLKRKIGSMWVNIRNEISEQFLISSIFSVTVFQEVPVLKYVIHSTTIHVKFYIHKLITRDG